MTQIEEIDIKQLVVSKLNVRKNLDSDEETNIESLANDIKKNGLINPISVRKYKDKYEIYAGQRRFQAIQLLKWKKVPCIVNNLDDDTIEEISLSENLQRNKMNNCDKINAIYNIYKKNNNNLELVATKTSLTSRTIHKYIKIKDNLHPELFLKLDSTDDDDKLTLEMASLFCKNIKLQSSQLIIYNKMKVLNKNENKKNVLEEYDEDISIDDIINKYRKLEKPKKNKKKSYIFNSYNNEKLEIPNELNDIFIELIQNDKINKWQVLYEFIGKKLKNAE